MKDVEDLLGLGVARVVLGTKACEDPMFLRSACQQFPGRIVVGIDARCGKVAIKGWKEDTAVDAVELASRCENAGASRIIYTDISRDGTSAGVNLEETARVARAVKIPIIASGGVASLDDIRGLKGIERYGVEAVIVGRALYSGAFTLRQAIRLGAEG
jgi:phosphoribosylformimino-5-aminoimidazole carboxamide ribotide isomerase